MLVDSTRHDAGGLLQFDVCIIGSGSAGIALSRELSRSGFRVCIWKPTGTNLRRIPKV